MSYPPNRRRCDGRKLHKKPKKSPIVDYEDYIGYRKSEWVLCLLVRCVGKIKSHRFGTRKFTYLRWMPADDWEGSRHLIKERRLMPRRLFLTKRHDKRSY